MKPGTRVVISEDCRPGGKATGQIGIYEGDFPLTVSLGYQPTPQHETEWNPHEYSYEDYKSGRLMVWNDMPANKFYPEWIPGQEKPRPFFAMTMTNPRIRLDDGSVIWGCECWWGSAEEGVTFEQTRKELERTKQVIVETLEAFEEYKKGRTQSTSPEAEGGGA